MRRRRTTPTYSLREVKRLVAMGDFRVSGRPRRFILNRYGAVSISGFLKGLFEAIEPDDFYKSEELDVIPGTFADIYRGTLFEGDEWYVKFYVDAGELAIVMSANWDGAIH